MRWCSQPYGDGEHSLSQITESNTVQNALIILNPLMVAPHSASPARAIYRDPAGGQRAMGLLILQEIALYGENRAFAATMTSGYQRKTRKRTGKAIATILPAFPAYNGSVRVAVYHHD